MAKTRKYDSSTPEITISDPEMERAIVEAIRDPINGIDDYPEIRWKRLSRLALQASTLKTHYNVTAYFGEHERRITSSRLDQISFMLLQTSLDPIGFSIVTVSNALAGLRPLEANTSAYLGNLVSDLLSLQQTTPVIEAA